MNKIFLTFAFSFLLNLSFSQTIEQIDSVTVKMCEEIPSLKEFEPKIQAEKLFKKHIPNFFTKFNVSSQEKADELSDQIYFRFQKNCKAFLEILSKLEENKSDWVMLNEKPKLEINQDICKLMFTGGKYYYKEYNGDIVNVLIIGNKWEETFIDGTTSTLTFQPENNCEFILTFIDSNNEIRKNLSVKGDVYRYGLYDGNANEYNFWVLGSNNEIYCSRIFKK